MRRGLKKEMVVEEEGEVGEVFTISREGLGEGGQVQVQVCLKYRVLYTSPIQFKPIPSS